MNKTENTNTIQEVHGKSLVGKVVSMKMKNTVVVEVVMIRSHPMYQKNVRTTKRFKAHCEIKDIELNSMVKIQEVRPISKSVHYTVREKVHV